RARLEVAPDISEEALEELALKSPNAAKALGGAGVRKTTVRAPKLVNTVPDAGGPAADTSPAHCIGTTARVPAAKSGDSPAPTTSGQNRLVRACPKTEPRMRAGRHSVCERGSTRPPRPSGGSSSSSTTS